MKKPAAKKPAAKKPAAKKPAAKKPAAKKPAAKKPAAKKPALPVALAKRAKALHEARLARLAAIGREAIARILERQADIGANLVDIGLALATLKRAGVAEALGRSSFAQVCEKDLKMAVTSANTLVALATRVPRDVVMGLGPDRARAVLELVDATPADDAPDDVLRAPVTLPSGKTLDVRAATAQEIREAAKELRAARPEAETRRSRGFSASPEEKKTFSALSGRLREHHGASVARLVAMRDRKGARVHFEVRLADLEAFSTALRKALEA